MTRKIVCKRPKILGKYKRTNSVFTSVENIRRDGVGIELRDSRIQEEIREELGRDIKFLCWPHGDNDERSHKMAMKLSLG